MLLDNALNGYWIEDPSQRENMNSFLYEMGMAWFKRSYADSTFWQTELHAKLEDKKVSIDGLRGPFSEPYHYVLKLDNQTLAEMDIGNEFGGMTQATAEMYSNSLIIYVLKPGSSDNLFTVTYNVDLSDIDTLHIDTTHFDSNVVWKTVYKRKTAEETNKEEEELETW